LGFLQESHHFFTLSTFYGKRYGYASYDEALEDVAIKEFKPLLLADFNLIYNNLFIKNLNFSVGVKNITDANLEFIQAYNGWHAPMAGNSREYIVSLNYNF